MPTTTTERVQQFRAEFPMAADALEKAFRAIHATPEGRELIAATLSQTEEQKRAQWNGTASDRIDRRLAAGFNPCGRERRRLTGGRTEQLFDPDDVRR